MLSAVPAFADSFEVKAEVPISCIGEAGTFAMFEEDKEIGRIHLKGGEKGVLSVGLTSLDYFEYLVKQVDMNSEEIEYDETEYTVKVVVILDDEDRPIPCISIYDEDGKKIDEIVFRNYLPDIPKTGDDSNLLLWGGIAAVALCCMMVVLILGKRREDKRSE